MAIFLWNDDFKTGIDEIDQQHLKLVEIINALNDSLMIDNNTRKVTDLLDELIDYTHYHFEEEELFMRQHDYDGADFKKHRINHQAFLKTIKNAQLENQQNPEKAKDKLLDYLVNWLSDHILLEDKEMVQHIVKSEDKQDSQLSNIDIVQNNLYGALRESEDRFKELANTLPALIWISNKKGRRVYCNKKWSDLTGFACERLYDEWPAVIYEDDRAMVQNAYEKNHDKQQTLEIEYRVVGQKGVLHWVFETVVPRIRKNGKLAGYMGCAIDISRQKEIEQGLEQAVEKRTLELQASNQKLAREKKEQLELNRKLKEAQGFLVQSEKMASIGQLAAGVAHEINNPLGYINSNLNTLQKYLNELEQVTDMANKLEALLPTDNREVLAFERLKKELDLEFMQEDLRDLVKESIAGATRAKKIVQNLRNFSRIDTQEKEMFDIEKGIDATLNIVHNELKYKAEVKKEYVGLNPYECIGSQWNQILMNLMVNAAHAIEEFGIITIRTGYKDNDWLWVEVEDTGKGIPEEIKNKIFDPFFTTKPVGGGTGLGLSLTYKIIQDHHGKIEIDSTVGKGTRFRIYFPLDI